MFNLSKDLKEGYFIYFRSWENKRKYIRYDQTIYGIFKLEKTCSGRYSVSVSLKTLLSPFEIIYPDNLTTF